MELTLASSTAWVQNAAEMCVFVCVQMAVCMTAPLTGMDDNGHSNRSPREAAGETVGVCVCVRGRVGAPGPRQLAPPTLSPLK